VRLRAVSALSLAFLVGTVGYVRAECEPTAVPIGDGVLVRSVIERLAANGVSTVPAEGCPAVRVRVERRGEQVHLEVTDSFARTSQRQVRDVATAAAIIESWTLQEIEQGTMPAVAVASEAAVTRSVAAPITATTLSRVGIAATFESSLGDNGSLWVGSTIAGCVRMGPLCIGGVLRGARDTHASGATSGDSPHHGDELHALATVGLPRRLGSLVVSPGVSVGYGRLAIATTHLDMHMLPFSVSEQSHELRGDVHVMISRPLGRRFAFYADVRGDAALARTEIAGGPRAFVRTAIGIRVEAP
jgi:hypothetical protein